MTFSNGLPMDAKFASTLKEFAAYARKQGCRATDAEVFAAFDGQSQRFN